MSPASGTDKSVPSASPIGRAATSGMLWLLMQSVCSRITMFISQLVLARILVPEDFGILGLAYTVTNIFWVFSDIGFDQFLMQRRKNMRFWATQVFWASFVLACFVGSCMAAFSSLGAKIYGNDHIIPIIMVVAITLPVWSLGTVPAARLRSQMRFRFIASYEAIELIVIQILIILLALADFKSLSFVLPVLFMAMVRTCLFWRVAPMDLRPFKRCHGWLVMLRHCASLLGTRINNMMVDQGDYITLGLIASTRVVGNYYFAFKLAAQPMRMIAHNFTSVLFPSLTALNNEPMRQRDAALKTGELIGVITVPVCFLQAAIARPGLHILFGNRWEEAITFIQILSIGLPFEAIGWSAGSLLSARGQFHRKFKYSLLAVAVFYILVAAGAVLNAANGVAVAVTIAYTIIPLLYMYAAYKDDGIPFKRILCIFFIPQAIAAITIGGACAIAQLPAFNDSNVLQIAVTLLIGGGTYSLGIYLLMPKIFHMAKTQVMHLIRR